MDEYKLEYGGLVFDLENNIITNPVSGETVQFIKNGKQDVLTFLWELAEGAKMPFAHIHRYQDETFTVVEGSCLVQLGKKEKVIDKGKSFTVKRGQVHRPMNPSKKPLKVLVEVNPASTFRINIETIFGLASEGKCNKRGKPHFWHMVAIHYGYPHHYRPDLPMWLQDLFSSMAGPVLSLGGIKSCYPRFSKDCKC